MHEDSEHVSVALKSHLLVVDNVFLRRTLEH
jgi:hypothetical protein